MQWSLSGLQATAVPPTVIEKLTNPALHFRVCSLISTARSGGAADGTFSSVLQWLGRQGIYPVDPRGSPFSSALLEKQHPFHLVSGWGTSEGAGFAVCIVSMCLFNSKRTISSHLRFTVLAYLTSTAVALMCC